MNGLLFCIIIFSCVMPILWILYFLIYPKNIAGRKYIYGVMNREEFKEEQTSNDINDIVNSTKKLATKVIIASTLIALILLLLHGMTIKTAVWISFTYLSLTAIILPYVFAHKKMMALKSELNITANQGVSFVDLKTTGNIHALKLWKVILPNAIGAVAFVFSILSDLKIVELRGQTSVAGSFLTTVISGTMLLTGVIIAISAVYIDNMANETISMDSDINANYNRAKKRTKASFFISFLWINLFFIVAIDGLLFIKYFNVIAIVISLAYMVMLIIAAAIFTKNNSMIEKRYTGDITLFTDDDEYWIGGLIYYNPNDKRMLVETRFANGSTINLATAFGKVIIVILALSILASVMGIGWAGLLESTPIDLRLDGDDIICHQLRDEYIIPISEIDSVEFGDDITAKEMIRFGGVGMDTLLKGNFVVDNEKGCKVFLNPNIKAYIHIKTNDGTSYYISSSTKEKTREFYETIK